MSVPAISKKHYDGEELAEGTFVPLSENTPKELKISKVG
jgi:hypothetical protein